MRPHDWCAAKHGGGVGAVLCVGIKPCVLGRSKRIRVGGKEVTRTLRRKQKMVDDDLPLIGEAYRKFRSENKEPGA